MKDVLASYRPGVAFDEMIDESGEVRPSYQAVFRSLERATKDELKVIAEFLANNYFQAGVTFDVGGVERPFPLDLVPRVIASAEWETIESGVAQRVKALEKFLADVYSDARVISDGVIPRQLVTSSTHYHRAVWGSSRRTASGCTSPAWTWCGRPPGTYVCWRTTSGCRAASRT